MSETLDTAHDETTHPDVPSEFDQLWRVATIGKKDLVLDLTDLQSGLKDLMYALIAAPIADYEDDFENGEDCEPLEWFNHAMPLLMAGENIDVLPYGWPEDVTVYGGSPELQKAREELARVKAELAAAKVTKAPKAPRKAREAKAPKEAKPPRVKKEKAPKEKRDSYAAIISFYVLTHPGMGRDEMAKAMQKEYPGTATRQHKGEPRITPLINPATVGLHQYLWRDKAADLKRAFPDRDWSFLGW